MTSMCRLALPGLLLLAAPAHAAAPPPDPLAHYYGNTLVCVGGRDGDDACHIWLERDGSFIMFGFGMGGHQGHYKPGPVAADGTEQVCLKNDTPGVDVPAALRLAETPPAAATPTADEIMLKRFQDGTCYALGPHDVGDHWTQNDNPLPGQGGSDRFFLLPGRR